MANVQYIALNISGIAVSFDREDNEDARFYGIRCLRSGFEFVPCLVAMFKG